MNEIAHRGYTTKYIKENTLEAFDNAVKNNFLGFECDVRLTKDNIPVICHDPFIDRCSNGRGLIKEKSYAELLKYNFGTEEVPSKIPTFVEVMQNYSCIKIIELKVHINLEPYIKYIDNKTYFISFNPLTIKNIKKKYTDIKAGILLGVIDKVNNYKYDLVCLLDDFTNNNKIINLQQNNILVFIYGIYGKVKTKNSKIFYITNKK